MIPDLPGVPAEIRTALNALCEALAAAQGDNLVSVTLYGGVARGRYRAGRSDVNVAIVLQRLSPDTLATLSAPLEAARRDAGVLPMVLGAHEVRLAAQDFPSKFLDIAAHHLTLCGRESFAGLTVPSELVRRRVAQSLRNMLMRLRVRFIVNAEEPGALREALAGIARPLAIELVALLRDAGEPVPEEDRTAAIYAQAATRFALDAGVLARLASLREAPDATQQVRELAGEVLVLLDGLSQQIDALAGQAA